MSQLSIFYHSFGNILFETIRIDTTLAKILAVKTPGMPATTETVCDAIKRGNRYRYTHVPKLIGSAVVGFRKATEAACGGSNR